MQDIHSIGGGRFFGGGGDRRLRPNNHHQALNCPRCDSVNTKFCYYNNYNLSQPRHFCKSCRRYWTKGGVLRNVPVGGGCRKSKRSKPKSTAAEEDSTQERKSNSHSSSESSSLTATTTAGAAGTNASGAAAAAEVVSASTSNSTLPNFLESGFFVGGHSTKASFEQQPLMEGSTEGQIFQDIGSFTSLMTSSNDPVGFSMADISTYRLEQNELVENQNSNDQSWRQPPADDLKMPEISAGFFDQTGQVDFSGLQQRSTNNNSALAPVDWQTGGDGGDGGGLFDLTGDQCYWSHTQWNDNDHSLNYLP